MDFHDLMEYTWVGEELTFFFQNFDYFLTSLVPAYLLILFHVPYNLGHFLEANLFFSVDGFCNGLAWWAAWFWSWGDGFLDGTLKWVGHGVHRRVLKYVWLYHWVFKWVLFIFPKWSIQIVFDHYTFTIFDIDKIPIELRTFRTYTPRSVFLVFFFYKFFYKRFFPYLFGPYLDGVWRSESIPLITKLAMHMVYNSKRVYFRKKREVTFMNAEDVENLLYYRTHWPDYYDPDLVFDSNLAFVLSFPYSFALGVLRFIDVYMRFHSLIIGVLLFPVFTLFFYFWGRILPVRRFIVVKSIGLLRLFVGLLVTLLGWRSNFYSHKFIWIFWVFIYFLFFFPFNFFFSVGFLTPLMWGFAYSIYFFSKPLIEFVDGLFDLWWTYFIWIVWDVVLPIWEEIVIWDEATDMIIEVEPRIEWWVMQWLFMEFTFFTLRRLFFNRWYYPLVYYFVHRPLVRVFRFFKEYLYRPAIKPLFLRIYRGVGMFFVVCRDFIFSHLRRFLHGKVLVRLHLFFRHFYLYRRFYRFCYYHRVYRLWSIDYRFLRKNRFRRRGKGRIKIEEFECFSRLNYTWIMREITLPDMVPFENFWKMERRRFYDRGRSARTNVEGWVDEFFIGKPYFAALSSVFRLFVSSVFLLFICSEEGWTWFMSTIPFQARMFAEVYILTLACLFFYFTSNWFRYWFTLHANFYFAVIFCCWHSGFWLLFPIDGTFFESNALLNIYLYPNFIEAWYVPLKWFVMEGWSIGEVFFDLTRNVFYSGADRLLLSVESFLRVVYSEKPGVPVYEDNFGSELARELVEILI